MSTTTMQPVLVKEGPLVYLNQRGKWVKKHFVLDDIWGMSFYSDAQGKANGHVVLGHDTVVRYCKLRDSAFEIQTPFVKMSIQAKNDAERDEWISAIHVFISNAQQAKKTEAWKQLKKKAEELRQPKANADEEGNATGTITFAASAQQFEVDARYSYRRTVGQGAYGTVVAVADSVTGQDFAIKKIRNVFENPIDAKRILREIKLLRFLKHKNISHLVDIMRGPATSADFADVYIVMPLMDTDLHRVIQSPQRLSDQHVQFLIFQLLSAVYYLESCHVIHRDLKPSNILVNAACELRVCDFGLARGLEDSNDDPITVYVVTRWYRAPELLLGADEYTSAIDMWSVGCILAELIGRKPLFPGDDYLQQIGLIVDVLGAPSADDLKHVKESAGARFLSSGHLKDKPPVPLHQVSQLAHASEEALDLLKGLLAFAPDKRTSSADALKHPYLKAYHGQQQQTSPEVFHTNDIREPTRAALREAIMAEVKNYRRYAA